MTSVCSDKTPQLLDILHVTLPFYSFFIIRYTYVSSIVRSFFVIGNSWCTYAPSEGVGEIMMMSVFHAAF